MNQNNLNILVCPLCKGALQWHTDTQELWCIASRLAYPVKDGIPYMLIDEARELSHDECVAS